MDKKYIKSTIEDFTQNRMFIQWVKKGKNNSKWIDFVKQYPEKRKDIETAKKIIELLESNKSEIQDHDIYEVWHNVDHFYQLYHKRNRKHNFTRIMRYAAIFIVALSIGVTIPYFYFKDRYVNFSEVNVSHKTSNDAKLILADGVEIKLDEKESNLFFDKEGKEVKINNDSIIQQSSSDRNQKIAMNQVVIPFGKRANLELPDGTKVWLNAGSKLIFPTQFNDKTRRIFLEGEAYFDVSHNKQKPFIVSTSDLNVTVLGTEFNFSAYPSDNEFEAVLIEGSIKIKENKVLNLRGKETLLEPGQKAVFNKNNHTTQVLNDVDLEYYSSWRDGILLFKTESILNVFKRLSRYYDVEIITERSVDVNNMISGKLDLKDSLDEVLSVVSEVAPISYTIDNNKVFIYDRLNNYIQKRR